MADVLRQLHRAANRTDVRLDSVTPQAAAAQSGYSAVPMDVVVTGRYFGVQRFLRHLRTQAGVAGPHVHAAGRLFSVDSVNLAAGDKKLPQLAATIHLNVFTYNGSPGGRHLGDAQDHARFHDFDLGGCRREGALMSTLETQMAGRRVAAGNADRRKKLFLVGLLVLLAGLLAIQLPKLLKSSDSPSSTAAPSATSSTRRAPAPPVTTPATGTAAATGGQPVASAPASAPAKRASAIRRMKPRDPFVPVSRESALVRVLVCSDAARPRPRLLRRAAVHVHVPPSTVLPAGSAPTNPAAGEPGLVTPAGPTAAVIWTNGKRQVVGMAQTFDVGDATFKLVAVNGGAMRLQAAGGSFTGGKRTLTIRKGRSLILENKATGVRYTLRFAGGTTEAATAPADPMAPSIPAASANPFGSPSGGTSASNGS